MRLWLFVAATVFSVGIVAIPFIDRDPPRHPERYESAASFDIVTPNAPPAHSEYRPVVPTTVAPRTVARKSRGRHRLSAVPAAGPAPLACLNRHEGSPAYSQHDADPYSGRYQFDQQTWDGAAARSGHPEAVGQPAWQADAGTQDDAARQLYAERGTQPWSRSARRNC